MRRFSVLIRTMACGLCATACISSLGCGGGDQRASTLDVVPVTGKVTFQGKPLAGAAVVCVPKDTEDVLKVEMENGKPAGEADEEGGFALRWIDQDGAPPGSYDVIIMAFKPGNTDTEAQPETLIPLKYNNPKTSGLTAVIKESGENVFDFNLGS